jgi:TRAP-type mannitol/chloroaromatic compound transport system permease small subunit
LIDLAGAVLLLIPFAATLLLLSLPYVARSWATLESSRETSGLPFVFLLKSLIPGFAVLMVLQGLSQAAGAARGLRDSSPQRGR